MFEVALDLVLEEDLRTLDALQLGAALYIEQAGTDLTFVSADRKLVTVAADHGLITLNPTTD